MSAVGSEGKQPATAAGGSELKLDDPPSDGISSLVFGPKSDLLLSASWDRAVRLYDTTRSKQQCIRTIEHKAAVLDVAFSDDEQYAFSGGIDRVLMQTDLKTGKQTALGSHEQPIKCVEYSSSTGLVVTGSWDCSVNLWDARASKPLTASVTQAGCKVYTMSLASGGAAQRLVVGTSGRHVYIYDVRAMATPEQVRESSLMNQTRCIRCFPDGSGYSLSSTEGRVAIEYFNPDPNVQKHKYAFKCHRKTTGKTQTLYPVNAMSFHPLHGTFATGGCDGFVTLWDWQNKKRICQYPQYPTSVAALAFNRDGTKLAVASSYTWEEGEKDHPADAIFVRAVSDSETKPKARVVQATTSAAPKLTATAGATAK